MMRHKHRSAILLYVLMLISTPARGADPRFLKTRDLHICDHSGAGETVLLRGTNLGGWLVVEDWMCPWNVRPTDDFAGREILSRRFGEAKANRLIDVYEDAWITGEDLEHIRSLGMNTVRVPFWYRNLQSEAGEWREDAFGRLDWVVREAEKRKLYVILDLHGVPGGQSEDHTTGRARNLKKNGVGSTFWKSAAEQQRTLDIWARVAEHFRGNATVAAYDLLNEPIGAPSRAALWEMYDRLYRRVRSVDADHVITVEGCWSGKEANWEWDVLPPPTKFGWANVVYQTHSYDFVNWNSLPKQLANNAKQCNDFTAHRGWNVPGLVGEFNPMGQPEAWKGALMGFDQVGLNWTTWSYKFAGRGMKGKINSWGIYNPIEPRPDVPDLEKDSAEEIERKWKAWRTDLAFEVNPMLGEIFNGRRQSR